MRESDEERLLSADESPVEGTEGDAYFTRHRSNSARQGEQTEVPTDKQTLGGCCRTVSRREFLECVFNPIRVFNLPFRDPLFKLSTTYLADRKFKRVLIVQSGMSAGWCKFSRQGDFRAFE